MIAYTPHLFVQQDANPPVFSYRGNRSPRNPRFRALRTRLCTIRQGATAVLTPWPRKTMAKSELTHLRP
ncbi:hypothetical protein DTO207G8_8837 [Paecilomyces variotii]|nr:hypothetical protein DTO207G8_8837 [Paecilomyces variotii]KAJ9273170.1 hypothetical protein DTO212C5_755 [Paecilomyces variotii]